MGYRTEIYAKAFKIKNDAVKKCQDDYESKLSQLRQANPDFAEIEFKIGSLGASLTVAAMSGNEEKFAEIKRACDNLNKKRMDILKSENICKPEYFCPLCEDSGYSNGGYCSCIKTIAKSLVSDELSRTMPIANCRFDNFSLEYYANEPDSEGNNPQKRMTSILKLCKSFAKDFPNVDKSLLFIGGVGLGKTHLSLAIVNEVIEKGYGVIYGPVGTLFSAVEKEHFSSGGETEKLDALLNADLLVIDDLGTEFTSPFFLSLFYNIVNSRILNNKPTIINTNFTFDQLEEKYSPRITSRFIGHYEMRRFIGTDVRQQKAVK